MSARGKRMHSVWLFINSHKDSLNDQRCFFPRPFVLLLKTKLLEARAVLYMCYFLLWIGNCNLPSQEGHQRYLLEKNWFTSRRNQMLGINERMDQLRLSSLGRYRMVVKTQSFCLVQSTSPPFFCLVPLGKLSSLLLNVPIYKISIVTIVQEF